MTRVHRPAPIAEHRWTESGISSDESKTHSQEEGMKHEPIGHNQHRRKYAKLSDGSNVDDKPDDPEEYEIGEGCDADAGADFTQCEAYPGGNGVGKWDGKDSFGLDISLVRR